MSNFDAPDEDPPIPIPCSPALCGNHGICRLYYAGEHIEFNECECDYYYTGQACEYEVPVPWASFFASLFICSFFFGFYLYACRYWTGPDKPVAPIGPRVSFARYLDEKQRERKMELQEMYKAYRIKKDVVDNKIKRNEEEEEEEEEVEEERKEEKEVEEKEASARVLVSQPMKDDPGNNDLASAYDASRKGPINESMKTMGTMAASTKVAAQKKIALNPDKMSLQELKENNKEMNQVFAKMGKGKGEKVKMSAEMTEGTEAPEVSAPLTDVSAKGGELPEDAPDDNKKKRQREKAEAAKKSVVKSVKKKSEKKKSEKKKSERKSEKKKSERKPSERNKTEKMKKSEKKKSERKPSERNKTEKMKKSDKKNK